MKKKFTYQTAFRYFTKYVFLQLTSSNIYIVTVYRWANWTWIFQGLTLKPMLQTALRTIDEFCAENNLSIVGYYESPNLPKPTTHPSQFAEKLGEKLRDSCKEAFLFTNTWVSTPEKTKFNISPYLKFEVMKIGWLIGKFNKNSRVVKNGNILQMLWNLKMKMFFQQSYRSTNETSSWKFRISIVIWIILPMTGLIATYMSW